MPKRVFVVGHSAVTCLGRDMNATWTGLIAGRSGLKRHDALGSDKFLRDVGGIVEGLNPGTPDEEPLVAKLEAKSIHLAVAAAKQAWADSGLDSRIAGTDYDPHRASVCIGTAFGGQDTHELETQRALRRKSLSIGPYLIPSLVLNQASGQVSQHLGLYGPSVSPANACAAGGHAIACAGMYLRAGEADLAVCGGTESTFTPPILNGFATMKALAHRREGDRAHDDASLASRPFSADRTGFVMSEGAAMLVIATEEAVKRLGLKIQAELLGWGSNSDGYHMTSPSKDRIVHLLRTTLQTYGLTLEQIDYYNAHGTSTPVNDRVETEVLKEVFGDLAHKLPISSIKGALGHALGAASAIEAAVCVRALLEQVIPPTINYLPDADLDLDYVPHHSRPAAIETLMSASFGFGGTNNVLIMKRGDHD
jgi:3-oxoacyl-[acyl-carrier-protein] synthase II